MITPQESTKATLPLKIVRNGFVQAMNGHELWVNTETDEMIKIVVHDETLLRKLYCSHVKITIETFDE
jgi:hypothetical protein